MLGQGRECLGRRWPVVERRVRPDRVVVLAPLLDDDLCFSQAVEDFTIKQFITELAVERLAVAVLPRAAWFDEQGFGPDLRQPAAHDLCRHLSAVVGPDMLRHAPHEHDISHRLKYAEAIDPARDPDGQAFARKLVDQGHQPQLAAIMGLGFNKVIGPDMITPFRP